MPRTDQALDIARRFGGIGGDHHKAWVIDQMVRALTDCPWVQLEAVDYQGKPYTYMGMGESERYKAFVAFVRTGEDGPETYDWEVGTPP